MTNFRLITALTVLLTVTVPSMSVQAAIPSAIDGQQLPSLAPMLEKVTPAVVNISVSGTQVSQQRIPDIYRYFFNLPENQQQKRPFRALGSGVIIDAKKGYIVTNHHVINDADKITVTLTDGRQFEAKKLGSDKDADVALLQIDADNLTAIKFSDSDQLRVGDFAVAIGNPFGLGQTVTSGIVSALGRSNLNIESFENFIQTDAAINSGNSGGALVNLRGQLVGINTAILGPNGGNVGIGFAIPANMVQSLTQQLAEFGEVRRGVLGVSGRDLNADIAEAMGFKQNKGAFVNQVFEDSPADKAGLKPGDIIVSVNGRSVRSFGELRARIGTIPAGTEIKLGIIRDDDDKTINVTLGKADEQQEMAASDVPARLRGAVLVNTDSDAPVKGVEVQNLDGNSPAAAMGLQKGDIIIAANNKRVKNVGDLRKVLKGKQAVVALNVRRGNSELYLFMR